jgi:hypothetical protein
MTPTDDINEFPETDVDFLAASEDGEDANLQTDGSTGFQPNNTDCLEDSALLAPSFTCDTIFMTEEFVVRTQEEAKQLAEELFGPEADAVLENIQTTFEQAVATRVNALIEAKVHPVMEENEALRLQVWLYERMKIEDIATEGLALTQRERLLKIAEAWDYSGDADAYGNALMECRKQLFPKKIGTSPVDVGIFEPDGRPMTSHDPLISAALQQTRKLYGTNDR